MVGLVNVDLSKNNYLKAYKVKQNQAGYKINNG